LEACRLSDKVCKCHKAIGCGAPVLPKEDKLGYILSIGDTFYLSAKNKMALIELNKAIGVRKRDLRRIFALLENPLL
jgi:hypothetical protein